MTSHPLAKWTSSSAGSPMPETAMASAFLTAVLQWARPAGSL